MEYAILAKHERDDIYHIIGPFRSEASAEAYIAANAEDGYDYAVYEMFDLENN